MKADVSSEASALSVAPHRRSALVWHLIAAPFIYAVAAPIAVLDLFVSAYQSVCFRIWRIPRTGRSAHVRFDRHKLDYLNPLQRMNCLYCSYANGVLAYASDIASKTEQYWCPIRHEESPPAPHKRYHSFLAFGDAKNFHTRWDELRSALEREAE